MNPLLTKYHCGLGKVFSVQHCLLAMLEKWKNDADMEKVFGALLTDFPNTFVFHMN